MKKTILSLVVTAGMVSAVTAVEVINTDFTAIDGYTNNTDLTGQQGWVQATSTGVEAFKVLDAGGAGLADTAAYSNSFDTVNGNGVYYSAAVANNAKGDEFSGSITMKLSIEPVAGLSKEKAVDVYDETGTNLLYTSTNTYDCSGIAFGDWAHFGMVGEDYVNNRMFPGTQESVTFSLRGSGTGGAVNFNVDGFNSDAISLNLSAEELGWDPNWILSTTTGPDFESDEITLKWRLRKTEALDYIGRIDVVNETQGVTNEGVWIACNSDNLLASSDNVHFGMIHDFNAVWGKDFSNAVIQNNGVQFTLDYLSVDSAVAQPPIQFVPEGVSSTVGDGSITLSWFSASEADGYVVTRYSDYTGGSAVMTTNVGSELTFTELGLTNGWSYFYTVSSDYGVHGSMESERFAARPLANVARNWGPSTQIVGGHVDATLTTTVLNENLTYAEGAGTGGEVWAYNNDLGSGGAPALYGALQYVNGFGNNQQRIWNDGTRDYIRFWALNNGGYQNLLIWMETDTAINLTTGSHSFELDAQWARASADPAAGNTLHAAVLNGTQWYVSETSVNSDNSMLTIGSMKDENWTPLTKATSFSSDLMSVTGASYSLQTLNNVQAIGFFWNGGKDLFVDSFVLTSGESATPLQKWTDGFNIYNEDADAEGDYDGDGVNNVWEWGLYGDPTDSEDNGLVHRYEGMDASGDYLLYIHPRLTDAANRPAYSILVNTEGLAYGSWIDKGDTYVVGTTPWAGTAGAVELVTNAVPIDVAKKFFTFDISE